LPRHTKPLAAGRSLGLAITTLLSVTGSPALAAGDARVEVLERELQDLQHQLAGLKSARHPNSDAAAITGLQRSTTVQYAAIKQRLDSQSAVRIDHGRLTIASADGAFTFALRSIVQFDAGYFAQGRNPPGVDLNSGTNFRRAQFGFTGTAWRDWSYNFTYDFGGNGVEGRGYLYRAYIQYDALKPVALRVGAFSPFDSIEDATGGANLALMERPTAVTIARSIAGGSGREGAQIFAQGENYLVSLAYTGGRTTDAATFDEQQGIVGRVAWLAVDRSDVKWLLNADATHVFKIADVAAGPGSSNSFSLNAGPELAVDGSRTVDTGALDARHVTEFGLETAVNLGRLFGQGGWFHYDIARRSALPSPAFHGWYAMATWSLSGETRVYDPATASFHGLLPTAPLGEKGFGAWEVAARYSNADLDYLPGTPSTAGGVSGGIQNIWSAGLNWYPTQSLRFMLDYDNIHVSHSGMPTADISADAVGLRSQIAF
jgi:phosphate-selective porin OprO/OprP